MKTYSVSIYMTSGEVTRCPMTATLEELETIAKNLRLSSRIASVTAEADGVTALAL